MSIYGSYAHISQKRKNFSLMKRLNTIKVGTDIYRLFLANLISIDFPPEIVKHHICAPIIEMMQYIEAKIINYDLRVYTDVEYSLSFNHCNVPKEKKIPFSIRHTPIMKMIGYLNYEYRSNIEFVYLGYFFSLKNCSLRKDNDASYTKVRLDSGDMCDIHQIDSDTTLSDLMMLSRWKKLIYNSVVEVKRRKIEV